MSPEAWLGIAGLALVPLGGLIAWMFTVARDLGMIAANTNSLTKQIEDVSEDNHYIRNRIDEHSEKFDDHAKQIGGLRMDVLRLESSVRSSPHTHP